MRTLFDNPEYSLTDLTGDVELGKRIADGQEQLAHQEAVSLTAQLDDLNGRAVRRAEELLQTVGEALAGSDVERAEAAVSLLVEVQMHGQSRRHETVDPKFEVFDLPDAVDLSFLRRTADRRALEAAKKVSRQGGSAASRNQAAGHARKDSAHAEQVVIDRRVVRAFGETLRDLEDQLDDHVTTLRSVQR